MKAIGGWVLMLLVFSAITNLLSPGTNRGLQTKEVTFPEFIELAQKKELSEVTIVNGYTISAKVRIRPETLVNKVETTADTSSPQVLSLLKDNDIIPVYVKPQKPSVLLNIIVSLLPVMLFLGLFFLIVKRQTGGGGLSMFGKTNARQISKHMLDITFDDVAGSDEAKEELEEVVQFLKTPAKFKKLGARPPKGVLMQGPPGTGKTLLAKAVAGEANVPFFFVSGSEFVEMFVGVGASRVRDLFEQAKMNAPCVIFIDEIDAVGKQRGVGLTGGHDEREQTLNQLLVEMDGFETSSGIIVIAATNRADVLDKALLRPGRFDRLVTVENPDLKGREAILKVHTKKVVLSDNINLNKIARGTTGFSGAELENLVNEAAISAAKNNKLEVDAEDFEYARDKLIMGPEKKSKVMSEEERTATAYHEAGHAIVGKMLKNTDPIHKVTILPRGNALGVTQTLPKEDRVSMTKERADDFISFLMGGRIAEEMILNRKTTGASNDIERATELARKMVVEWGMSEKLGPLNYTTKQNDYNLKAKDLSEKTSQTIDDEIKRVVESNYERAVVILKEKTTVLHEMAKMLLDKETLDSQEVDDIFGKHEQPV